MANAKEMRLAWIVAGWLFVVAGALPGRVDAQEISPEARAEYENPVHQADFPDPFVLNAGEAFYAYATHGLAANIQIMRSSDLVDWQSVGTALPLLPDWATGPEVWAPSVLALPDHHVLYYTVRERTSGLFCVSAAVGAGPEGPFIDRSAEPLVCQRERGGTIDPSPFAGGDGLYLLFKSEGLAGAEPTRLWSQRLSDDGLSLAGARVELLRTAEDWEGPIIENPAMTVHDGTYHLLYAANRWESDSYAVGHAACVSPLGPCERVDGGLLFGSTGDVAGPGGAEFFRGPNGGLWLAYHAWTAGAVGYPEGERSLRIDRIAFADGRAWTAAPTSTPTRFDAVPRSPEPPSSPPTTVPDGGGAPDPGAAGEDGGGDWPTPERVAPVAAGEARSAGGAAAGSATERSVPGSTSRAVEPRPAPRIGTPPPRPETVPAATAATGRPGWMLALAAFALAAVLLGGATVLLPRHRAPSTPRVS